MAIQAAFTIKGNLDDGSLLAESIMVHMTKLARDMKQFNEDHPRTSVREPMPEEFTRDQQTFIQLERLYRELTGNNPKFPSI